MTILTKLNPRLDLTGKEIFSVKSRRFHDLNSVVKVIFQQNLDAYNRTDTLFILPLVFNILNDFGNMF